MAHAVQGLVVVLSAVPEMLRILTATSLEHDDVAGRLLTGFSMPLKDSMKAQLLERASTSQRLTSNGHPR